MGKKRKNGNGNTRLIDYDTGVVDGRNYCYYILQQGRWERNGGGKNLSQLLPMIEGKRYSFAVTKEARDMINRNPMPKKLLKIVSNFPVVDATKPF